MKKFAICCLVLAVAAVFVPTSQAQQDYCLTFTNFSDQVHMEFTDAGGITGNLAWGDWDWEGPGTTPTSLIGTLRLPRLNLASRPYDPGTGYVFAYSTGFVFKGNGQGGNFDLAASCGIDCGSGGFFFQLDQPYTVAKGSCGFDARNNGKPRLLDSRMIGLKR